MNINNEIKQIRKSAKKFSPYKKYIRQSERISLFYESQSSHLDETSLVKRYNKLHNSLESNPFGTNTIIMSIILGLFTAVLNLFLLGDDSVPGSGFVPTTIEVIEGVAKIDHALSGKIIVILIFILFEIIAVSIIVGLMVFVARIKTNKFEDELKEFEMAQIKKILNDRYNRTVKYVVSKIE